jgi:hypothetical protein
MGDMMPYQLEKGATLRLFEQHLNKGRPERRAFLGVVRQSYGATILDDQLKWFVQGPPGLWADPAFARRMVGGVAWSGAKERDHLIKYWFGFKKEAGQWVPHSSARPPGSPPTTGFWIAYKGEVHKIVCGAVRWALELSLGLGPNDGGPGRENPWPIELFWKCLAPWFEAWVVQRPTNGYGTGLVSIILVTPTHDGANLAESPIATSPSVVPAGGGRGVPSTEDDYEVLGVDGAIATASAGVAGIPAAQRTYATWVVTHRQQIKSGITTVTNNVGDSDLAEWGIPQLACYEGTGPIVAVSPSMAAGGVKHDGSV